VVAISTDGVDWTVHSDTGPTWARKICFGNGIFVAVGYYQTRDPVTRDVVTHALATVSKDGIAWIAGQDILGEYNTIGYGAGVFIAAGGLNITNGTAQFTDPSVPGLGRRFYKAEMNLQ
jgi:hypothetical protein